MIQYANGNVTSGVGNAVDPSHAIFAGPFAPVGTSFTGTSFSHDIITGTGYSAIMSGTAGTALAEMTYGAGRVVFGGLTTDNFRDPDPQAQNLTRNIIAYADSPTTATPEPASVARWRRGCSRWAAWPRGAVARRREAGGPAR